MPDTTIQGRDGAFAAYRVAAKGGKGPGIVLLHEIFGITPYMRGVADGLAGEGFTVLCPDLFWRQEPGIRLAENAEEGWNRAAALYRDFNVAKGVEDIQTTLNHLRNDPACTGMAGAVGFCLGGRLAYLAATRTSVDCSVGYYGIDIQDSLDEAGSIRKPLLLHIAERDKMVPPHEQGQMHHALDAHSKITIFDYPAVGHAFARESSVHHDHGTAGRAHARTLAFLRRHLASVLDAPIQDTPPGTRPGAAPAASRGATARQSPRSPASTVHPVLPPLKPRIAPAPAAAESAGANTLVTAKKARATPSPRRRP